MAVQWSEASIIRHFVVFDGHIDGYVHHARDRSSPSHLELLWPQERLRSLRHRAEEYLHEFCELLCTIRQVVAVKFLLQRVFWSERRKNVAPVWFGGRNEKIVTTSSVIAIQFRLQLALTHNCLCTIRRFNLKPLFISSCRLLLFFRNCIPSSTVDLSTSDNSCGR